MSSLFCPRSLFALTLLTVTACSSGGNGDDDDDDGGGASPASFCSDAAACADDRDAYFDEGDCVDGRDDLQQAATDADCAGEVAALAECQTREAECDGDGFYHEEEACTDEVVDFVACAFDARDEAAGFEAVAVLFCEGGARCEWSYDGPLTTTTTTYYGGTATSVREPLDYAECVNEGLDFFSAMDDAGCMRPLEAFYLCLLEEPLVCYADGFFVDTDGCDDESQAFGDCLFANY